MLIFDEVTEKNKLAPFYGLRCIAMGQMINTLGRSKKRKSAVAVLLCRA